MNSVRYIYVSLPKIDISLNIKMCIYDIFVLYDDNDIEYDDTDFIDEHY